jgi:hypothetical protein
MAWTGTMRLSIRALAAALLCASPAALAQKAPSPFTVANVTVEAQAADSVEAKRAATQTAETRAFRTLVSRLIDFRAASRIPDMQPAEIERLVSDIQVRGEGVTGTGYVATFGVTFSERAITALFSRHGVIPILDRGPEILIVPVLVEDGTARVGDRNPWRGALLELDLTHALVPAKVAPIRQDITAAIANSYTANASAGVEALKTQHRTQQVVLAVANTSAGSDTLTLKLAGTDATGLFSLERKVKASESPDEPLMRAAARLAFDTVQERWKLTRDSFVQGEPAGGAGAGAGSDAGAGAAAGAGYMTGEAGSILITAQFSGLKEWQTIRQRLQDMPGVQNWDLKSVNPRSATISFDFPGGAARLTAIAGAQGLAVENGPDGLTVKTR